MGYLYADFGLPRPLCSRFRPDVRDRQTDRQTSDSISALCPRLLGAGHNNHAKTNVNHFVTLHYCDTSKTSDETKVNELCGRPPQYAPAPCKLTFDLLTLKVVSESRVTWATSVPTLVFLGLSVLDLGPMYATDRPRTSDRRQTHIIA